MKRSLAVLAMLLSACSSGNDGPGSETSGPDEPGGGGTGDILADVPAPESMPVEVLVLLDGEPAAGVVVGQGGRDERWTTGPDGKVTVIVDNTVEGDVAILASHPEARIGAALVFPGMGSAEIELVRFDPTDNPEYAFQDPGMPGHSPTSAYCGHCHVTIGQDFDGTRHSKSASNPVLHDLYSGTSSALTDESKCVAAGGKWLVGRLPGGGASSGTDDPGMNMDGSMDASGMDASGMGDSGKDGAGMEEPGADETGYRCYLGQGVLPALNPDCGDDPGCNEAMLTSFGGCADCHAPGIDGKLGGRNLLDAKGAAYSRGIHCDVCHHVESVDDDGEPGVGGRLRIVRPSDPSTTASFGDWQPLLFGPHDDIPNPFMGVVQRPEFREARFCAGCHELERGALVPGGKVDAERWPSGRLPLLSTFSEWTRWGAGMTCQSCHMPWDPDVANTADLQLFPTTVGLAGGWYRTPPSVRRHVWQGPGFPESSLRSGAASVALATELADGIFTVNAATTNEGAGHGLPSGEPLRSLVLLVEARCGDEALAAVGGDAVPDFGGYLDRKVAGEDWTVWPGATVGDLVRVVARTGDFHDYEGYGRFGDGSFEAEDKGMPVEEVAGQVRVTEVDGDQVTFDGPLPDGDVAYRTRDAAIPAEGDAPAGFSGAQGFGFARVLVDAQGRRMVPHFLAVDVASDNRLVAGGSWVSTHRFSATCEEPTARAVLLYRRYPIDLARERGWQMQESVLFDTQSE